MNNEGRSEESVMDFLTPLLARFDKIYHDLAKRHGESYFGMWVLEEIGDRPEGVTQKQLCEILYSLKQTVNSLITSYVRRGLVETKPNSSDGRSKLHVLTAAGKEKLEAIRRDEKSSGLTRLMVLAGKSSTRCEGFCSVLLIAAPRELRFLTPMSPFLGKAGNRSGYRRSEHQRLGIGA